MKKKLAILLALVIMPCLFLFSGCLFEKTLTASEYIEASSNALYNSYDKIITSHTNLLTHSDFTFSVKSSDCNNSLDDDAIFTEQQFNVTRSGKGENTLLKIQTIHIEKDKGGNETTNNMSTIYFAKYIDGVNEKFYKIEERKSKEFSSPEKVILITYETQLLFEKDVYNTVVSIFSGNYYGVYSGSNGGVEAMNLNFYDGLPTSTYGEFKVKGDTQNCELNLSFLNADVRHESNDEGYNVGNFRETQVVFSAIIKDGLLSSYSNHIASYKNNSDTIIAYSNIDYNLSYEASLSAPSISSYLEIT